MSTQSHPAVHKRANISPDASSSSSSSSSSSPPAHWIGNPPTHFTNPWSSYNEAGVTFGSALKTRFGKGREWVPVPDNLDEVIRVRRPDWGRRRRSRNSERPDEQRVKEDESGRTGSVGTGSSERHDQGHWKDGWDKKLKATWLGHAGFVVELPVPASASASSPSAPTRGITILLDAVFADRMSPVSFAGPKRFTPPPCAVTDLPPIDIVLISHSHYDHLDIEAIKAVYARNRGRIRFFAGLGMKTWFMDVLGGLGVRDDEVWECDWWDQMDVEVDLGAGNETASVVEEQEQEEAEQEKVRESIGLPDEELQQQQRARVRLTCCPAQHGSGRTPFDRNKTLWCSWAVHDLGLSSSSAATTSTTDTSSPPSPPPQPNPALKSLYFAGDTALQSQSPTSPSSQTPRDPCPVFSQIGSLLGPFTLALLPIGCFNPREWMSNVHASPRDSLRIHEMVRAERSLGMHWGTIRGGISGFYESVDRPRKEWEEGAREKGIWWDRESQRQGVEGGGVGEGEGDGEGTGCGLCDIGETVGV